jgi:ferric-dicitrate binding protein FerR (iron transport regulator)
MNKRTDIHSDDAFVDKAKQLFDESVEALDGETRSKLNRGRQAALAELGSSRRPWIQWAPAGGVAVAAVAALLVWSGGTQIDALDAPEVASDMEILLAEDSLEMLEDLEFYSWIDLDDESLEI